MSSFVPLNVEIEEESEDEIDDSKEIQIEEALKLYQNALKLHSQGPDYFNEAEDAYKELFRSEIFTWEESMSEAQLIERYTNLLAADGGLEDDFAPISTTQVDGADGAPSSVPQILYLAYKNHGQFLLDRIKYQLSAIEQEVNTGITSVPPDYLSFSTSESLKLFVEALDRDDTDLELWRLASKLGGYLGSERVARFCLEAVLDSDEADLDAWTESFALDVGFAKEELKRLLHVLDDQLSQSHISKFVGDDRHITSLFKKRVDPLPYLPIPFPGTPRSIVNVEPTLQTITAPLRTYASCGQAMLYQLDRETMGLDQPASGASYFLRVPGKHLNASSAPTVPIVVGVDTAGDPKNVRSERATNGDMPTENLATGVSNDINQSIAVEHAPRTPNEDIPTNGAENSNSEEIIKSPTVLGGSKSLEQPSRDGIDASKQAAHELSSIGSAITTTLPDRKRSTEVAELPDPTDAGRSRSKRIKARGSFDPDSLKDSTAEDWAKWYEQQLQIYHQADDLALELVGTVLQKFGSPVSVPLATFKDIVNDLPTVVDSTARPSHLVAQDLKCSLDLWDLAKSKAFLNGHDPEGPAGALGSSSGLAFAAFMEPPNQSKSMPELQPRQQFNDDQEVESLIGWIQNQEWTSLVKLAYRWLEQLICCNTYDRDHRGRYESMTWPSLVKETMVHLLVSQDEAIYRELEGLVEKNLQDLSAIQRQSRDLPPTGGSETSMTETDREICENTQLAETIFELHLDIYGSITNPRSTVGEAIRAAQRDRLSRWAALSSRLVTQRVPPAHDTKDTNAGFSRLEIRYMWASVVCNSLLHPTLRDNTIFCYQELIHILHQTGKIRRLNDSYRMYLPNNAIMPEISAEAAQREVSRLTTMDFFMGIFNPGATDPLTTVESLEPLLELSIKPRSALPNQERDSDELNTARLVEETATLNDGNTDSRLLEALAFLEQGSATLRLALWQRLQDAYLAIDYPPQVLSCDFRMIGLIVDHLESSSHTETETERRRDNLLRWLHRLDAHISRSLTIVLQVANAFDCLDSEHVATSMDYLRRVQKLLHVFALWEDTIRVGKTPPPAQSNQNAIKGLARSTDKFRDMIVKIWTLQYKLLKEAIAQNRDHFKSSSEELTRHLGRIHQALGLRCYCSLAKKAFLRVMKEDLEKLKAAEGWDVEMSQLMYDLYGVKVSMNSMEMQDHGCMTENLDRATALEIMDVVMAQVNRISIKDLLKSDLKFTMDKMQQVIKIPKVSQSRTRTFNFRLTNNYLKSPLNPHDLCRSLQGIGGLCGTLVLDEGSEIASKGWYAVMGHIALAKFRSLKRSSATPTDDLSIARTFLRHDLEFDLDKWESWYRLGQVYDALVEEATTWTADKLDNHMEEIVDHQRKAIHSYSMAMAVGTSFAEDLFDNVNKMADLCAEFGTRVYASTREPFSMKAFNLEDYKRHYNSKTLGPYLDLPFKSMQLYSAWKFASILLRRASTQKPQHWVTVYNFGKVLWKMHNCSDEILGTAKRISYQPAIDAFIRAVEACPEKRDSRHPDKDPVLEPHYKLLSVVHKLVRSKRVSPDGGRQILQATPYARKGPDFQGEEGWNGYVWQILKGLRVADKSNWHHRMAARAAHIMYDDEPNDPRSAVGARNELSQQIFTKTMSIQVWKPDNERPGRHFVYTGRYVRFFTRLLYQLNDKPSLEALARRIRKRAGDFVNHAGVWEEVCRAYLKLLHHQPHCNIMDGYTDIIFQGLEPETFQLHATRLETFVHALPAPPPLLEILREAIELKKLNNNLFRPINIFEDLIRDIYAHLYDSIIPGLVKNDAVEENRVRMRVDNILSNPMPSTVETPPPELAGAPGGEQPKKTLARYITARELVRKAEAIAAKPAPTVPTKVFKNLAPAPTSEVGNGLPGSAPKLAVVIHADGSHDAGSSVPGSVHDSADDESELSEVDDEVADAEPEVEEVVREEREPMFLDDGFGASAEQPEEVGDDTNDEREVGDEGGERVEGIDVEEGREKRDGSAMDVEGEGVSAKESGGVPEDNW